MASMPLGDPANQHDDYDAKYVQQMARVDGCDRCINHQPPISTYLHPDRPSWVTRYRCADCGYAWTTEWSDD